MADLFRLFGKACDGGADFRQLFVGQLMYGKSLYLIEHLIISSFRLLIKLINLTATCTRMSTQ